MRTFRSALLAGVATATIGFTGVASAQPADTHVMTVRLPDGGVAEIRYSGDVAPRITFGEAPAPLAWAPARSFFGPNSPFAMMERLSADMDRQMAAMFSQADMLADAARSDRLSEAALRGLPPDTSSYSFVSTLTGNGVCTRSVEITSQGNGAAPSVVSHSSGNCGATAGPRGGATNATGSVGLPLARPPSNQPDIVWTGARGAKPYSGLVREIPPAPTR